MISVVLTTYNYGKYIERAIRSCLDQTLDNSEFEVIVVNDCSTDFTEKILVFKADDNWYDEIPSFGNELFKNTISSPIYAI